MAKNYKTFIDTIDSLNKVLASDDGSFYGKSIKFKHLAGVIFADTDKDSVILIKNCVFDADNFIDFYIDLNLKRDGSLFFSTNVDETTYYDKIVSSKYRYGDVAKLYDIMDFKDCKLSDLIINKYFSPANFYFNFACKINNVFEIDNPLLSDLFDINANFPDLKKAKFLTYSKIKGTTDYKIKFKQSGNEYQLQYFTASIIRNLYIGDFLEDKINSYASEFNYNKALMIEAVMIDLYNEAKLIHTEVLPEIESAKKQIYDVYEANRHSIKAKLEDSFNAYISDTQNPASYIMIYKNDTWQTVDRASYDDIVSKKYSRPIYAKYDRLTNRLIELCLPEVTFNRAVDYYINH